MSSIRAVPGALSAPNATSAPTTSTESPCTALSNPGVSPVKTTTSEGALNPFCENFDTELALRSGSQAVVSALPLPRDRNTFISAPTVNNIWACVSLRTAPFRMLQQAVPVIKSASQTVSQRANQVSACGKRRQSNDSSSRRIRGVLQAMMDKAAVGPLSTLAVAVADRRQVRVTLRSRHSLRGCLTARLVAFDKHLNLVLRDAIFDDPDNPERRSLFSLTLIRGEHVVAVALI